MLSRVVEAPLHAYAGKKNAVGACVLVRALLF